MLVKNGVEVQPCPVKVLDTDTITQVHACLYGRAVSIFNAFTPFGYTAYDGDSYCGYKYIFD